MSVILLEAADFEAAEVVLVHEAFHGRGEGSDGIMLLQIFYKRIEKRFADMSFRHPKNFCASQCFFLI